MKGLIEMVGAPSAQNNDVNYHPANKHGQFLRSKEGASFGTAPLCPFVELIELVGLIVGIDVVALGKEDGQYCGVVIPAYPHESGAVFMTCARVRNVLEQQLAKLEVEPVSDDEILQLRNMTQQERISLVSRLAYEDEKPEIIRLLREAAKSFEDDLDEAALVVWAQSMLEELNTKATGSKPFSVVCPQAPKSVGPLKRY